MNKLSPTHNTNNSNFDYLKLVLSLFVVSIHSKIFPLLLYPWLRMAVPLFFIMSSYFLFSKIQKYSIEEKKTAVKKHALRNIKLYLFWFILLLPITLYVRRDIYFSDSLKRNIFHFFRTLFMGSTFVASWYITASIIGILLLFYLSRKLSNTFIFIVAAITFCLVTLWSSYSFVFDNIPVINKFISFFSYWFGNPALCFLAAIFWMFIGKCFAERKIKTISKSLNLTFILFSAVGLFIEWHIVKNLSGSYNNDSYFLLAPLCISLFMYFQHMKPTTCKYSAYLRRASTVIYASHGSVIAVFNKFICEDLSEILLFVTTLVCCVVIYIVIEFSTHRWPDKKIAKLLKYAF